MILSRWLLKHASRIFSKTLTKCLSRRQTVTGHRTSAVISSNFKCSEDSPPPEVHFFLSYEDWTTSYWSYDEDYKLADEREVIAEPTASLGVSSSYVTKPFVAV